MSVQFFALGIETFRLVAAEIPDRAAAVLLDEGQPILLGTIKELHKLAARLKRPLVTIARIHHSAGQRSATPVGGFRQQPSQAALGASTRTVQDGQHLPVQVLPAADRLSYAPAIRVA